MHNIWRFSHNIRMITAPELLKYQQPNMTPNIIAKCNNAPSKPKLMPLITCIGY